MGTLERRERHRGQLRKTILDATREIFVVEGYDAVTMRAVAERIEYSPTAIYGYFSDKHELVWTVCEEDWRHFSHTFRLLANEPDLLLRLQRLGTSYVQFAVSHPHQYRLLFMTPGPLRPPCDPAPPPAPILDAYAFLNHAVSDAIEAGCFPRHGKDDAELVANALWLAVHGVAAMHITRGGAQPSQLCDPCRTAALLVDTLIQGLCSRSAEGVNCQAMP